MPHHVTTRCVVTGLASEVERFKQSAFRMSPNQQRHFDFNAFIPMPALIAATKNGNVATEGAALVALVRAPVRPGLRGFFQERFLTRRCERQLRRDRNAHMRKALAMPHQAFREVAQAWLNEHPDYAEQGEKRLQAIAETGFADWHDWSVHHWGTKWNAYDLRVTKEYPLEFSFDTAWDFPEPVFKTITREFPSLFPLLLFRGRQCLCRRRLFQPAAGRASLHLLQAQQ
jgi:hypothetical protein